MLKRKIDDNGFFVEDLITEEVANNLIEIPVLEGLYKPKWDGTQWVEGLTQDELNSLQKQTQVDSIKAQLSALDDVLPRCTEDMITSWGMDTSKLPQVMQDRLLKKQQLRQQLQSLATSQ